MGLECLCHLQSIIIRTQGFSYDSLITFPIISTNTCSQYSQSMLYIGNCYTRLVYTCEKRKKSKIKTNIRKEKINKYSILKNKRPRRWRSGLQRSPRKRKDGCSNPSRDRHKSLKQVVTSPLSTAKRSGVSVKGPHK